MKKDGFFNKLYNSIVKIENYPEMAAQGLGKAISYLAKIIVILSIILCLGMIYQIHQLVQEGISYMKYEFPEFSYNDGTLNIESQDVIRISEDDSIAGKTIIDTKIEDEQEINKYINEIEESGDGLIVLKDRIILKNNAVSGTINYNYKEVLTKLGIMQFEKQDVINYASSTQIISMYVSLFLTLFIYSFIMYFLTTLSNVILLSIFGYLTTWIAKIKMNYVAVFNMSIYSFTLSILLNTLYVAINTFIDYNMEYFQVMYIGVAAIYLVAAIFILKTDFIKKQAELIKIQEAEEIVKRQLEEKEKNEKEQKEPESDKKEEKQNEDKEENKNKDTGKEDNKEKEEKKSKKDNKKDNNSGEEPQGSNA